MDFKIGDDIDENGAVEHHVLSNRTKIIIMVVLALVAGISVFLITNLLFGGNKEPENPPVTKSILTKEDEDVIFNYKMLTYGAKGIRDRKFISGIDIDSNSFSNAEKYYFALQFAVKGDFTPTDRKDDKGNMIFTLPESSMDIYMERFFGPDVTYVKDGEISNTFKFSVNKKDTGMVKFNKENDEFDISLSEVRQVTPKGNFEDDVYYFLDEATSYSDGKLVLKEKVLYTKVTPLGDDNYEVQLFSDYDKKNSIGTLNNINNGSILVSADEVTETKINADKYAHLPNYFDIDEYKDQCGTITYNLKLGERGYYFVSSKVSE